MNWSVPLNRRGNTFSPMKLIVICAFSLIRSPPQGISTNFSSYFTQLDSSRCSSSTSSMICAPLSDANAALNVCASSVIAQWADSTQLSSLYSTCSAKSTSFSNEDVKRIYNTVYVLSPLRTAICSTSDNRQYCAAQLHSQSGSVDAITQGFNPSSWEQYPYVTQSHSTVTLCDSSSTTYEDTSLFFFCPWSRPPTRPLFALVALPSLPTSLMVPRPLFSTQWSRSSCWWTV